MKNGELQACTACLEKIGSRLPIKDKWALTQLIEPMINKNELLQYQVQKLIEEKGTLQEDGKKSLNTSDESYLELMGLDVDLDFSIPLDEIAKFNPSMSELLILKPIIKE